jgi:hypothetical protein
MLNKHWSLSTDDESKYDSLHVLLSAYLYMYLQTWVQGGFLLINILLMRVGSGHVSYCCWRFASREKRVTCSQL